MNTTSSVRSCNGDEAAREKSALWLASEAWGCAVLLILLSWCFNEILWGISRKPTVGSWLATPFATIGLRVFRAVWMLLVVLLFARPCSIYQFLRLTGLSWQPTLLGWFAAWIGVGIGWLNLYGIIQGWIPRNQVSTNFYHVGGVMWWSYASYLVLLAPFYEETVMRGFLYRAFRGSYKPLPSILLVLCVVVYFHWGFLTEPLTFTCMVVVMVLLCLIRERTGSLWNCILVHAAYNATVTLRWPIYVFGMIVVLPFCAR